MTRIGRVKWFDAAQGFGFIEDPDGDIFVHRAVIEAAEADPGSLAAGEMVEFAVRGGPRGVAASRVRRCARHATDAPAALAERRA